VDDARPSLALLVVFFVVPVLLAAYQSFFAWDILTPPENIGIENYRALASRASCGGSSDGR